MSATDALIALRPNMLQYDIPKGSGIRNPSRRLYPIAIRTTGSVWIIPYHNIPRSLLATMQAQGDAHKARNGGKGFVWYAVPFDPSGASALLHLAREGLIETVTAAANSARESYAASVARLQEEGNEMTTAERRKREKAFRRQMNTAIRNARKLLKQVDGVANLFGISITADVNGALNAVSVIQSNMKEQVSAFKAGTDELAAILGEDNVMVRAARADAVPTDILADYMQDHDIDTTRIRRSVSDAEAAYNASATPE